MVALAMAVAVLLGGGELLTAEAAVSAILIVSLDPGASDGFTVSRILEGMIGGARGARGLVVAVPGRAPCSPWLAPRRRCWPGSARTLERLAAAIEADDVPAAAAALEDARALDAELATFSGALARAARPRRCHRGGVPSWPSSTATRPASRRSTTRSATPGCWRATHCAACGRVAGAGHARRGRARARSLRLVARRRLRPPGRGHRRSCARVARGLAGGRTRSR